MSKIKRYGIAAAIIIIVILMIVPAIYQAYKDKTEPPLAKGTATEAVAMVNKAVDFLKSNDRQKAFSEFNHRTGQFRKDDLYIWVINRQGVMMSHGEDATLIGRDLFDLQDKSMYKYLIREILGAAFAHGQGWIDYYWKHPYRDAIVPKRTYIKMVELQGGEYLIVCCGIYLK